MTTVQELGITTSATGGVDVHLHIPANFQFTANWLRAVCRKLEPEATFSPYFCCTAAGASIALSTALDQNDRIATELLDLELPAQPAKELPAKPEFLLITNRREVVIEPAMVLSAEWLGDWITEVDARGAEAADWQLQLQEGYLTLRGPSLRMSLLGGRPYRPRYQRCSGVEITIHFDRYGRTGTGSIKTVWRSPFECVPNLSTMPPSIQNVQLLDFGQVHAEIVGPEMDIPDPTRMAVTLQPLAVAFLKSLGLHPEPGVELTIVLKDQPMLGLPHNSEEETRIVRRFGVLSDRS